VELAFNLVWAIAALGLLGMVYRGVRGGAIRISMTSAMMLAMLICLILLPVISVSDDLLDARQAALPLSGQTWRVASEGFSNGLSQLLAIALYLMLLMCFLIRMRTTDQNQWAVRPLAGRLVRSQRLRPPPCTA
jgi:amino acid transporter